MNHVATPAFLPVGLIVWLAFCRLVGRMAASLNRRPDTWFLAALLASPLVAFLLLFMYGDARENAAMRDREERIRELHPEVKDVHLAALNETQCPHCGADVNPVTGNGLHSRERTPWVLVCNKCQGEIEPEV